MKTNIITNEMLIKFLKSQKNKMTYIIKYLEAATAIMSETNEDFFKEVVEYVENRKINNKEIFEDKTDGKAISESLK